MWYDIVYSPDDEEATGKGFYSSVITADNQDAGTSPLCQTKEGAVNWAKENGGKRLLKDFTLED